MCGDTDREWRQVRLRDPRTGQHAASPVENTKAVIDLLQGIRRLPCLNSVEYNRVEGRVFRFRPTIIKDSREIGPHQVCNGINAQ